MNFKINPTRQATLILTFLAIGALVTNSFKMAILIHLCATIGFGIALFYIFKFISKQNKNIWNSIISCLIIFLVLNYGETNGDVIPALIVTFITIVSKFFLEYKGSPIFNPVVFGFFVLTILTMIFPGIGTPFVSWWGASYSLNMIGHKIPLSLILIAIWIIFYFKNWRKWAVAISYLAVFAIGTFTIMKILGDANVLQFLKFSFTDSTIYFLTFIMLCEPRTSPMLKNQQVIYGFIAAIFSIIYIVTNFPTSNLLVILIPNLYFFTAKMLKLRQSRIAFKNKPSQTPTIPSTPVSQ